MRDGASGRPPAVGAAGRVLKDASALRAILDAVSDLVLLLMPEAFFLY